MTSRVTESPPLPRLSSSELDVMKLLWQHGESTVRSVHERLPDSYDWVYSTTRTTMDRMVKKGLLLRKRFHGAFLYEPTISRPEGLALRVRDFAERVLEVRPGAVVALFADSEALTLEEVDELARLLEEEQ